MPAKIEYWHEALGILVALDTRFESFVPTEQDRKECIHALHEFVAHVNAIAYDICKSDCSGDEAREKLQTLYTNNPLALFIPGIK